MNESPTSLTPSARTGFYGLKFIGPPELKLRLGGRQEVSGERNPPVAKFRVSLHLPPVPLHQPLGLSTTDFVGDWWRTENYDRRRRIIANAPKPTAQSERADGSGTVVNVGATKTP